MHKGKRFVNLEIPQKVKEFLKGFFQKPKIVIFGASSGGKTLFERLKDRCEVTFFVDNDRTKWGKEFLGLRIEPPSKLLEFDADYDWIAIASIWGKDILAQLKEMGLERKTLFGSVLGTVLDFPNEKEFLKAVSKALTKFHGKESLERSALMAFQELICFLFQEDTFEFAINGKRVLLRPSRFLSSNFFPQIAYPYESYVTTFLETHLKKGMCFLDVGANTGYYTLLGASIVGEEGKVIALEPSSETFDFLVAMVEAFGFRNVKLFKKAAFDKSAFVELCHYKEHVGGNFIPFGGRNRSEVVGVERVEAVRLDDLVKTRVDFFKMDIEGGEYKAIRGMQRVLKEVQGGVVEVHVFSFSDPYNMVFEILDLMEKAGLYLYGVAFYRSPIKPWKKFNLEPEDIEVVKKIIPKIEGRGIHCFFLRRTAP